MEDNPTVSQEIEREVHIPIVMENIIISGQERNDKVVTSIEKMLTRLPSLSLERCIYKIPVKLRELNLKAYTPRIVSIGPFHHGEERLQAMEEHKLRHLKTFLNRTGLSLEYCVEFVRRREEKARRCYAETFELKNDEFVKMILVDGSFIVEFLLRLDGNFKRLDGNYKSCQPWMSSTIVNDMLLLENQLPFFVLEDLYNLVPPVSNSEGNPSFSKLAHLQFCRILPIGELPKSKIMHFVDFIHRCCWSSISDALPIDELPDTISSSKIMHIVDFMHCCRSSVPDVQHSVDRKGYDYPPTATELREAGIKFKKGINCSLFDIKFRNGIVEIPPLVIWDETEILIRNLIAFEQCHWTDKLIVDYMFLFDGMINTSKDVDLLIREGIIDCKVGSSEDVSALFNNICTHVVGRGPFHYSTLSKELHAYCKKPCHKWEATLRRDYFNTPWKVVSLSVALVLLVLTSIQTLCSIISL